MPREAFTVRTADGRAYLIIRDTGEIDAIGPGLVLAGDARRETACGTAM
jgi:hypothetical protein